MFKITQTEKDQAAQVIEAVAQISEALRFTVAEGVCPEFDSWVQRLEALANEGLNHLKPVVETPAPAPKLNDDQLAALSMKHPGDLDLLIKWQREEKRGSIFPKNKEATEFLDWYLSRKSCPYDAEKMETDCREWGSVKRLAEDMVGLTEKYAEPTTAKQQKTLDAATYLTFYLDYQSKLMRRDTIIQARMEMPVAPVAVAASEPIVVEVHTGEDEVAEAPVAPARPEPAIHVTPAVVTPSAAPTSYPIFAGINFYKDDTLNGDGNEIFKWLLQEDPMTCTPEMFMRGLLLCRVDNAGKAASFKRAELEQLMKARKFPGWPAVGKALKEKVKALIDQLKSQESFTADRVRSMSKNMPTLATYKQAHFSKVESAKVTTVPGDDLDDMLAGIAARLNAAPAQEAPAKTSIESKIAAAHARLGL